MRYIFWVLVVLIGAPSLWSQEYQRIAIRPNQKVEIGLNQSGNAEGFCMDYLRELPDWRTKGYNRVYSDQNVIIKLNGEVTSESFKSLIEGENPLLILQPFSDLSVDISLNTNYRPEKGVEIKTVEIEFNGSTTIGNLDDDGVDAAALIMANWKDELTQEQFWDLSICINLLKKNGLIKVKEDLILDSSMKNSLDNLLESPMFFDRSWGKLRPELLKVCLKNDCFKITSGNWVEELRIQINQINDYESAIWTAERTFYPKAATSKNLAESKLKNDNLVSLNKTNKDVRDTLISGHRYVLMLAWKSLSFEINLKESIITSKEYESSSKLFDKTLFMTAQCEMQKWARSNSISELTDVELQLRMKELLGLPPNSTNAEFIEFWVKEEDMFRPSIDPSLNQNLTLDDITLSYYVQYCDFFNSSYNGNNLFNLYPFTGRGYTYDYNPNNLSHKGLSEFVLREKRKAYIRKIYPTGNYLRGLTKG